MALRDRLRRESERSGQVTIERASVTTDPETELPVEDDWGQTKRGWATLATIDAWVQPMTVEEQRDASGGGAVVSTHRVFMLPTDIEEADRIKHGGLVYGIDSVLNAAGKDHHLEVMVHQVGR